jgi:hypothetical protein
MGANMLVPVMAIAIVNGIFSRWTAIVYVLYPVWYPSWAPAWSQAVFLVSALVMATLTIMVSGVPAALYERLAGAPRPAVTAGIWIAGALLLTLPALPYVLAALSA